MSTRERPRWICDTGLLSTTLPEPPYVQKFLGGQDVEVEQRHEELLGDAALDSLAQGGVNLVWLRFFAGCGIEFEKAGMEQVHDCIARLHARGMKAALLVALGSITPETLQLEEPDCHNWIQFGQDGQPPLAGEAASVRVRACFNAEGYQRYLERVCNLAVDFEADLIHFDEIGNNPEPETCRCPVCVAAFRDFLRQQYGLQDDKARAAGVARFGHNHFLHTRPPVLGRGMPGRENAEALCAACLPLETPHLQEWLKFKVQSLTQCLDRLATVIAKRKPECAVGADLLRSFGGGVEWLHGLSIDAHLPLLDAVRLVSIAPEAIEVAADQNEPKKSGRKLKHARANDGQLELFSAAEAPPAAGSAAAAEAASTPLVSARPEVRAEERERVRGLLMLANALKTGRGFKSAVELAVEPEEAASVLGLTLAFNPLILAADVPENVRRDYSVFLGQYKQELLLGATTLAAVAVFHDTPSLAFGGDDVRAALRETEELLLERNVPFEALYPSQMERLSRYRCIVLPECVCLSEELALAFETFVQDGGGLVVTGQTGQCDPWRRVRTGNLLSSLLGGESGKAVQREVGAGRVACTDRRGLCEAVRYAAGGSLPFQVEVQAGEVLAEASRLGNGTVALHLVNLGLESARQVQCVLACEAAPQQVLPLVPGKTLDPLQFNWDNGRVYFTIETLESYALVKLAF